MSAIERLMGDAQQHLISRIKQDFAEYANESVFGGVAKMLEPMRVVMETDPTLLALKQNGAKLRMAESRVRYGSLTKDSCCQDVESYEGFVALAGNQSAGRNVSFWRSKLLTAEEEIAGVGRDIVSVWRKEYDLAIIKRELELMEVIRNSLWEQIKKWLEAIKEIRLDLKQSGFGLLWDLSAGELAKEDIASVLALAKFIQANPGVRKLCDILGRLMAAEKREVLEKVMASVKYDTIVPDVNSKEEIVGLSLGKQIEDVVPSEIATMADDDLSVVFDQKYVESRLLCFDKIGYAAESREDTIVQTRKKAVEDSRGPIILCVDTSGSMSGAPEAVAKAVAFALASKAHQEGRPCYLINFSTGIEVFDFSANQGMKGLLSFLQLSFCGGTDVAPALAKGIEMMSTPDYSKADLIVISDFVMGDLPEDIERRMVRQKKEKNRFFALTIERGASSWNQYKAASVFDAAWRYDATNQDVAPLVEITDDFWGRTQE